MIPGKIQREWDEPYEREVAVPQAVPVEKEQEAPAVPAAPAVPEPVLVPA